MRKSTLLTMALAMVVGTTMGQKAGQIKAQKKDKRSYYIEAPKKWFVKAGLGYNFAAERTQLAVSGIAYGDGVSTKVVTSQPRRAAVNAGLQGTVGVGYMFNKYIGVCVNVNAGIASKKYTYENSSSLAQPFGNSISQTQQAQMPVLVTPSFYFQTTNKDFNLYSRVGLALPVYQKIKITSESSVGTTEYAGTTTMKTDFCPGFNGAVGVDYKINDNFHFWSEVSMLSLSLYTKESTITSYSVNGADQLSAIPENKRTTKYTEGQTTATGPNYQAKYTIPFSTIGLFAGISYHF
ncbi:OmpW family outer membrane protein [Taibaiella soli]|uniref:Outer membrane protein beta-barrel domain-containing protein n=1 Tax=Taibaiella soli TaxID=1649169 RepID=A0A2W2ANU4_9BACT|nr:OmpW family outer membrane protein [Taibaiella soli]PZF74040.1 hypothetical protein DN068_04930 [Taibaiella soli]